MKNHPFAKDDAKLCDSLFQRVEKRHAHCMKLSWRCLTVRCATSLHGTTASWRTIWFVPATLGVVAAHVLATQVVLLFVSTSGWRLGLYMDWPAGPRFPVLDQTVPPSLRAYLPLSNGSIVTSRKETRLLTVHIERWQSSVAKSATNCSSLTNAYTVIAKSDIHFLYHVCHSYLVMIGYCIYFASRILCLTLCALRLNIYIL